MKKLILILGLILCPLFSFTMQSESIRVQLMEGEFRGGVTIPVEPYKHGRLSLSYAFAFEWRLNFRGSPWDCGLMAGVTTASRHYESHLNGGILTQHFQNNRTWILAATGDYNFGQGKRINPFVGTAMGFGYNKTKNRWIYPSEGSTFVFIPRGGVEIARFLRIMGEFNLSRRAYNNFSLTLGLVVGGRPKKNKIHSNQTP